MPNLERLKDMLRALWIDRALKSHDSWTRGRLAEHQRRKLVGLVKYAVTRSSFYRELYRDQPRNAIRLQDLPVIDKRKLMDNFDNVVTDPRLTLERLRQHVQTARSDNLYLGQYRVITTAGTSGQRGIFVYDRVAWSMVLANTMRWNRFVGITPRWPRRLRICTIGADSPMHVSRAIPESGNVGLFRILRLEVTRPLSSLVDALKAFQPEVLMPYPSVAALLAEEQLAGRLGIHPRVITTHSEVLTEEMVRRIKAAWGVIPFNHYGLTEEPHVGCECSEHRGIHVFEDLCIVEVLDELNRPAPPGTLGHKCLLTNLYNRVQPLIRYEITDMLVEGTEPCRCGRPFSLITQIAGRSEDILVLKNAQGRDVAIPPMALSIRIESLPEVSEYQTRHSAECIRLQVVPHPCANADKLRASLVNEVEAAVRALGAEPPPVEVVFVPRLERPRDRMGKIKLVGGAPT